MRILRVFILLITALAAVCVRAQDNPFKMDDKMYEIYLEAQKCDDDSMRLVKAQKLYDASVERKDTLSQIVAEVIRMRLYYNKYDEKNLYATIKRTQKLARQCNNLMYYYYAWALKANYLKNCDKLLQTMDEAVAIKRQAERDSSLYGIYTAMRMLGNIHESRGEYRIALQKYEKALKYGVQIMDEQDVSPIYRAMGWCHSNLLEYEQAVEAYDNGYKAAKSQEARIACMLQKCFALYAMNRYADFERIYTEVNRAFKRYGKVQPRYIPRLNVMHYCIKGDYGRAFAECRKVVIPPDRMELEAIVCKASGDYRKALQLTEMVHFLNDSAQTMLHQRFLADMDAKIGNIILKQKTQQLELGNAKLKAKEMEAQMHSRKMLSMVIFVASFIIMLLFAAYWHRTRKLMARLRSVNGKLKENNRQLEKARNKAMEVERMKTAFVQSINHEIRTPLNAICGFAQVITSDEADALPDKADYCRRITDSTEQLVQMINEMIDVSTFESGDMKLEYTDVRVNDVCRSSLDVASLRKIHNGVDVRFATTLDDSFTVRTDAMRLGQILQQFLTNAIKNTSEGYVELACKRDDGSLVFTVTDTGVGIPKDKRANLFKKFTKIDSFKPGIGLGLHVTRHIAKALGGKVGLDADYYDGARFWLRLDVNQIKY